MTWTLVLVLKHWETELEHVIKISNRKGWKVELSGRKAKTEQGNLNVLWIDYPSLQLRMTWTLETSVPVLKHWETEALHVIKISKMERDRRITLVLGSQSSKGPLASQLCIIYQN